MRRVDLSNFNLNLLLALDGLLSQRSVTAAAKRVRVTPSAMSHSLSELRHLLGDPLLVRSGRGMVLTPRAEALVSPLHTLLMDAERLLAGGATFDPATTARRFVIAATDFHATLLMPALLDAAAREAPGTSLEIVPSSRRGNAWLLETGDINLAIGAIVDEAPGIRRMDLLTDGFACAARKGHPSIDGALDLDAYVTGSFARAFSTRTSPAPPRLGPLPDTGNVRARDYSRAPSRARRGMQRLRRRRHRTRAWMVE